MTKQKVPKLRFPEFTGEWKEIFLEEISDKVNKKNKNNQIRKVLTNSAIEGIVNQSEYFDRNIVNQNNLGGYYVVEVNDFIYNPRISKYAQVGPINQNRVCIGIMSPLYTVFRFNKKSSLDFMAKYFSSKFWHKYMRSIANYGARYDRMNIKDTDFFKMPIHIPSLSEQEKIADFLTLFDKEMELEEKKLDLLKENKKGYMQKIFNQELRFKDEFGNDYPQWEEKRLGKIFEISTGKSKSKFLVPNGKFYVLDMGSVSRESKLLATKKTNCVEDMLNKNDLIMIKDDIGGGKIIGKVIIVPKNNKYICGDHVFKLVSKIGKPLYFYYCINSTEINIKIRKKASGTAQLGITTGTVANQNIYVPSLPEQEKIANFLSTADEEIELMENKVEKLKEIKKGLLQQMFI